MTLNYAHLADGRESYGYQIEPFGRPSMRSRIEWTPQATILKIIEALLNEERIAVRVWSTKGRDLQDASDVEIRDRAANHLQGASLAEIQLMNRGSLLHILCQFPTSLMGEVVLTGLTGEDGNDEQIFPGGIYLQAELDGQPVRIAYIKGTGVMLYVD